MSSGVTSERKLLIDDDWAADDTSLGGARSEVASDAYPLSMPSRFEGMHRLYTRDYLLLFPSKSDSKTSRDVIEDICTIVNLPANWDSHGAYPIDIKCATVAIEIALLYLTRDTPRPSVVPTVRGGIQVEWHVRDFDVELKIDSPEQIELFFEDLRTGESWEEDITTDSARLITAIEKLSSRG
ncbi:MAG: hypothetical protein WDZ59_10685 [Pirellulales bacterium]